MPLQMFMKMDGVRAESANYQYRGWSEVLSWNWGMTSNRKSAGETDAERTSLNELSIIKPVGVDSADIRLRFAQGTRIANVDFIASPVVSKREAEAKYVSIRLEEVVIKSIVCGGTREEGFFKEHICLLFDRVRFGYTKGSAPNSQGGGAADAPSVEFDFGWSIPLDEEWAQAVPAA